ncbi:ABC transporter ATP-binding protein [Galbitalea sp. SE-J8]|uniref:ABC transporter ATP-binding protein n=1 Tax=Galbitalea sp. SE-J8 TaxID=3054952 RepID=UPI00259CFCA6|nr:ABC transporter ATP-binding protein [Galbitalea sp. SE-J8]MDM4762819.1 ABC transporter ATP-binding protein [Galbitalea sp. SE-J8]
MPEPARGPATTAISEDACRLDAVSRRFGRDGAHVTALDRVSLRLKRGTFAAVMGPSGSGKSTLLHCAAGLDRPDAGEVYLGDTRLTNLSESESARLRRNRIGFVFQSFNLLPTLTVRQNVALPFRLAGIRPARGRIDEVLDRVGLAGRARHRPGELSGGQQQRVAIARALAPQPDVIFADEPTGALDLRAAGEILRLLRHAVDGSGQSVVMVTHDPSAASYADRVLILADGRIVDDLERTDAARISARLARLETDR